MSDAQSPNNSSANDSVERGAKAKRPIAFWIRVGLFTAIVLGCGWYSRFFQTAWTSFFPHTCANGDMALFAVDFSEFYARLGEQFNSCAGIGDGTCRRRAEDQRIQGECRDGQMQGPWSLENTKTGAILWSGTYCTGLPCGEFHRRLDGEHEEVFRVEQLTLQGPATLWDPGVHFGVSGQFDHGKRIGRWVRYVEPAHTPHSSAFYDNDGFNTTMSYYCTNGNRREIRGDTVFLFDSQGNILAKHSPDGPFDSRASDPSLCPMPNP